LGSRFPGLCSGVACLFTHWDECGWHRVTFYGDLREPVKELAAALKLKFIEEA
jgi:hypothetical protein